MEELAEVEERTREEAAEEDKKHASQRQHRSERAIAAIDAFLEKV